MATLLLLLWPRACWAPAGQYAKGILVILGLIIWIGWHVITAKQEKEELEKLARQRRGPNDWKSNITDG